MLIFDPKKETFTVFRMAYPMPFYTRGLDGRIDDPNAGWKGRGIWATYSSVPAQIHGNPNRFGEPHSGAAEPVWRIRSEEPPRVPSDQGASVSVCAASLSTAPRV